MRTADRAAARQAHFYVAPTGNDAWSGLRPAPDAVKGDGPFRSLARARDAVRGLKQRAAFPARGVVIDIAAGVYPLSESLALDAQDSGLADAPVTYRAAASGARVIGGQVVSGFAPVTDAAIRERLPAAARDAVVQLHLPSVGVTDFGHMALSGFHQRKPLAHLQLFFDGQPMRLAEWPNGTWTTIAAVPKGQRVVDNSGKPRGTSTDRFHYTGDRPQRWRALDDVWVHGYWFVDWADQYLRVKSIDTDSRAVVIAPPQSGYGYKKGQRFRFLNVLEELDQPGEYYLDRKTGMLTFWPPSPVDKGVAMVSLLTEPLLKVDGASHVRFQGLALECGRSDGAVVTGGQDVLFAGCAVRNLGGAGIRVHGGRGHRVQSCDLYGLGDGGIYLSGGDRQTLIPAGHVAENNHIHHFAQWVRTYRVGVRMSGVGLRASHNLIHDAPHSGITYSGNDHVIEYNELHSLCLDTGDVGGIYTGRDWSARGTVIRSNHIHHLGGLNMGSNAVYLDDLASGQTVVGNVIHHVWRAMMIGGGRDNIVENNIFADFRIGIHFDARGIGWSRKLIEGRKGGWDMYGRLESVPYREPPYATKYPQLPNIMNEKPLEPKDNRIARNVFIGTKWLDPRRCTEEQIGERGWARFENNTIGRDSDSVVRRDGVWRARPNSPAHNAGFKQIPVREMGLQVDQYRTTLPADDGGSGSH